MWEVFLQDFCPRDINSCHIAAGKRVKLWSLSANLFFKEPHQLHLIGPLKQYLAENISLQRSKCSIYFLHQF